LTRPYIHCLFIYLFIYLFVCLFIYGVIELLETGCQLLKRNDIVFFCWGGGTGTGGARVERGIKH